MGRGEKWKLSGIRLRKCADGRKGKWGAFPWMPQKDQMDCGPACLKMISRYYVLSGVSEREPNVICHASREGVSLHDLAYSARQAGFRTEAYRTQISFLASMENPCILLLNTGHFVVYAGMQHGKFSIADPAVGMTICSTEDLQRKWYASGSDYGVVLTVDPSQTIENHALEEPEQTLWTSFKQEFPAFRSQLGWLCVCFLLSGFFAMLLPLLFQGIVDVAVAQKDWPLLGVFLAAQFCLYLGQLSSEIVRTWIVLGMGTWINLERVSGFLEQLVRLHWPFFANRMLGDIMLRVDDHRRIEKFLLGPAMSLVMSVIQLFFLTLVLLKYSPLVFGFVLMTAVFYYWWYRKFLQQRAVLDYELFSREAVHRSMLVEMVEGMQEIKISGSSGMRITKWRDLRQDYFFSQVRAFRLEEKQNAGIILAGAVRDILITGWTAYLTIEGHISVGMLFSIQFVVGQMGEPIRQWIETARMYQDAHLSFSRIQDVYREPVDNDSGKNVFQNQQKTVHIRLDDVSFGYPGGKARMVINNLSMEFGKGFYAIVGESGCGKTSLLKLLLGFYTPQKGIISMDGVEIDHLNMEDWRKHCGVVLQDGYIFSDTISRNVVCSEAAPDLLKIQEVLNICCLWDWVESLPRKLETMVGKEGVGLSQGQKQRLLLARALYKNPSVLLLDEATNALDVHTESMLWDHLLRVFEERTTLVVAHRLSTVVKARRIFVMKGGQIVEQGTHRELLDKKSFYYELVKYQMYE